MFNFGMPLRCSHDVVDYQKIDYFVTRLYCKKCGETMGVIEDSELRSDVYVTGIVRPLTDQERQDLR